MSYNSEQWQENNFNSCELSKLNTELSQARAVVDKYEESLKNAKEHVSELTERLNSLKNRQNELATSAGLRAPIPGQKATVGYHRRARPSVEPPHSFECLSGTDQNFKKMEDLAAESLQEALKVLTAVKRLLKRENNWCLGHSDFFESVFQNIADQIKLGFEVTVVPTTGNQMPDVPEVITNDLSFRNRYTDLSALIQTTTQQGELSQILDSTRRTNMNALNLPELTILELNAWL